MHGSKQALTMRSVITRVTQRRCHTMSSAALTICDEDVKHQPNRTIEIPRTVYTARRFVHHVLLLPMPMP